MKLGIIVSAAFWTAVAVGGFWGWLVACAAAALAYAIYERKGV